MDNQYFIWSKGQAKPTPIVPREFLPQMPANDARYFVRILECIDRLAPNVRATFVITWHMDAFDEVMKDAVVIWVGDERYQVPSYQRRVRTIFKTGGISRNPLAQTLRLPPAIAWRALLRDARNGLLRMKRRVTVKSTGPRKATVEALPLGYSALQEIDPLPIAQRPVDVFFAGGVAPAAFTLRPSVVTRQQMVKAMTVTRAAMPQLRIETIARLTTGSSPLGPQQYTQALADAKIALAPRGNFDETFRLFEAAKSGCVIVTDPLPPRWYYQDCPAVVLRAWSELPDVVRRLFSEPARLAELSVRTRQWWDSTVSEPAMAKYLIRTLGLPEERNAELVNPTPPVIKTS